MNSQKLTEDNPSIDDILESIKNTIQSKEESNSSGPAQDEAEAPILELTEIVSNDDGDEASSLEESSIGAEAEDAQEDSGMISSATAIHTQALLKDFAETAESLGRKVNLNQNTQEKSNKSIEHFVLELIEPHIKEWLNANLPIIVKEVVSEEVKNLVANMNNNK